MAESARTLQGDQGDTFATQLRRLRESAGLSQEALAERAGLSPNAIGSLERGERRHPYPATVRALSDALGLTADERAILGATLPRRGRPERPAKSTAAIATGLPLIPTSFFGRERDVAAATSLLAGGTRLLTLTGPGGVGKTQLALHVAAEAARQGAGEVFFVPLAPTTAPDLVIPTIARALNLREAGNCPIAEVLRYYLRSRTALLVLDNFEQI